MSLEDEYAEYKKNKAIIYSYIERIDDMKDVFLYIQKNNQDFRDILDTLTVNGTVDKELVIQFTKRLDEIVNKYKKNFNI